MGLRRLMENAYGGKPRHKRLESEKGDKVISIGDLAERFSGNPKKEDVAELVNNDILPGLLSSPTEGKKEALIWGYITSIAAERSNAPVIVPARDFAGLELSSGTLILKDEEKKRRPSHVGERMISGVIRLGDAGDYLGQEMSGGGVIATSCGSYAFRNMRGGWGVISGDAGSFIGVNNSGGRILVKGSVGERAGWLMRSGRLTVLGDAGDYVGILAKGGVIKVRGKAGRNPGWRARGGRIELGVGGR